MQVIFAECGREEAQTQLDEMKRALVSPITGAKQDPPHYSCESPVQSFPRPILNMKAASGSTMHFGMNLFIVFESIDFGYSLFLQFVDAGMDANWPASTPSPPLYDSRSTFQVSVSILIST